MARHSLESHLSRSRALDLAGIAWEDVPAHPVSPETLRTLRYMQDIESHTIVYLRTLLGTRALDDPELAAFLACWFYEETFHGIALARFLAASGAPVDPRVRSTPGWSERLRQLGAWALSRGRADFAAVHMLWGAINELTTLTGYRRLSRLARHPILSLLLSRIVRDESRHFAFYFEQARQRLAAPGTRRLARGLVERFWAPVGSGVQPEAEVRFVAGHLFAGAEGRAEARRIDATIRELPGLEELPLFEAWLARAGV